MVYLISGCYFIINFFREKKDIVLRIFFLILLLILAAGNYSNSDYHNYLVRYEEQYYTGMEIGWAILCSLFYKLHFSFAEFRFILFCIWMIVLIRTISSFTENVQVPLALYFVFPFFLDVVQLRNLIVSLLIMQAFKYLLKPGIKNDLVYLLYILVAFTFHQIALWYGLFIIAKYWRRKWTLLISCILLTVIGCVVVYMGMIEKIARVFIKRQRVLNYLENKAALGVVVGWMSILLVVFLFFFFYKRYRGDNEIQTEIKIKKRSVRNGKYVKSIQSIPFNCFSELLFKVNSIQILSCILICYNATFFRIVRNVMIFNYIFVAQMIYKKGRTTSDNLLSKILILILIGVISFISYYGNFKETILAVMECGVF